MRQASIPCTLSRQKRTGQRRISRWPERNSPTRTRTLSDSGVSAVASGGGTPELTLALIELRLLEAWRAANWEKRDAAMRLLCDLPAASAADTKGCPDAEGMRAFVSDPSGGAAAMTRHRGRSNGNGGRQKPATTTLDSAARVDVAGLPALAGVGSGGSCRRLLAAAGGAQARPTGGPTRKKLSTK